MSKLVLATAITVVAMVLPAAAQAETPASAPVNLNLNIVTIVLILGVSISLAVMYALSKLIPQIRSGEFSLSKFEFDWRAELLNRTPKKEKKRRAAEMACRAEEFATFPSRENDESSVHYANTQPLVELREGDEVAARSPCENENSRVAGEHVAVTVPRE